VIKAIIFDLDNTLIDFLKWKKMAVSGAITAMRDAGLKISQRKAEKILYELYGKYGIEYQKIFQVFLKEVLGKVDYKILASAIVGYRKVQHGVMSAYPKVKSTLIKLKEKGIKLAILTDAPRLRAWLRLAETGLVDFFDYIITYEDSKFKKPHKKPFQLMLRKLKLKPGEILMVGDSLDKDIQGAKSLGIKTCYSKYGEVSKKITKNIKPDFTIKAIEELLEIVEKN
jgi:putative hydrolase of the HAD superfamily